MDRYRVEQGTCVDLSQWDPSDTSAFPITKKEGRARIEELNRTLEELQELLYAAHKHKVLIVLQATDTGGKGWRHPARVRWRQSPGRAWPASRSPPRRAAHDYLWRVHKHVPGRGEITIFNRSHHEDVLVARVHELAPESVWSKRYDQINAFERMLWEEGTTILKFYLHIDAEEKKRRLQARLDRADKLWKFNPGDLAERKLWPDYAAAYEQVLSTMSTAWAPWYIIPANRKWYSNLVIGSIIVDALNALDMRYPETDFDPSAVTIE